jgi:hypothetical protein
MTPAALTAFNDRRLVSQYLLFGRPVTYVDADCNVSIGYTGCHSAVTNSKELRDGGFMLIHDFVCRLRKSDRAARPREEANLVVDGITYRIAEVIDHPLSGEWKLGLRTAT